MSEDTMKMFMTVIAAALSAYTAYLQTQTHKAVDSVNAKTDQISGTVNQSAQQILEAAARAGAQWAHADAEARLRLLESRVGMPGPIPYSPITPGAKPGP